MLGFWVAALQPGDPLFGGTPAPELEAAGTVVQCAPAPDGGFDALAALQIGVVAEGQLRTNAESGSPVQLFELPYVLLQDI